MRLFVNYEAHANVRLVVIILLFQMMQVETEFVILLKSTFMK